MLLSLSFSVSLFSPLSLSMVVMPLVRQVVPVVHRVLGRAGGATPECIESRIFADFRRASFAHERAPAGSPGRSTSSFSVLRGRLDRGRPCSLHLRQYETRWRGACVLSRTHTRNTHEKRGAILCVLERTHSICVTRERERER